METCQIWMCTSHNITYSKLSSRRTLEDQTSSFSLDFSPSFSHRRLLLVWPLRLQTLHVSLSFHSYFPSFPFFPPFVLYSSSLVHSFSLQLFPLWHLITKPVKILKFYIFFTQNKSHLTKYRRERTPIKNHSKDQNPTMDTQTKIKETNPNIITGINPKRKHGHQKKDCWTNCRCTFSASLQDEVL